MSTIASLAPSAGRPARWPVKLLTIDVDGGSLLDAADALEHGIELSFYSDALGALLGVTSEEPQAILAPTAMRGAATIDFVDAVVACTDIPVIIGIGPERDALEIASAAIDHGASSVVALPSTGAQLVGVIRNLGFRDHRDAPASKVTVGRLELDPQAFRVTYATAPVILSAREFGVLHRLMLASPRVLTPEELIDSTHDQAPSPDAMRTIVKKLRQKLQAAHPGGADRIRTIFGQGYQLLDA